MMLNRLSLNRIGLNRIGLNRIGKPSGGSSDRPYIDPKVLDSLCGVWIMDQNTNESESRNIIKNKIADRGGDLELLNFAYKANSGYNGYQEDFTSWRNSSHLQVEYSTDGSKFKITSENIKDWWLIVPNNGISNSFKVKVTNCHFPIVWRYTDDGNTYKDITISEDGIYNLPQSIINNEGVVNRCCFGSGAQRSDYTGLTIEQLPLYEGALVTDGKDDMIVSQKTVQEMLGGSKEITVVSMIHQIELNSGGTFTNYIRESSSNNLIRNKVLNAGKTGIYGYKCSNLNTQTTNTTIISEILGDKKDYDINVLGTFPFTEKFSVVGYGNSLELSSVACYWTFIANKVLTTDEINQIIAYYKLDKYVTPQVIYDVKRQGLTNDTPSADWYLKDFSGNGYDMQLYNYAKKLNSGVGKYEVDFLSWNYGVGLKSRTHDTFLASTDQENNPNVIFDIVYTVANPTSIDIESFTIDVKLEGGAYLIYFYVGESDTNTRSRMDIKSSGRYTVPKSYNSNAEVNIFCGFYIGGLVGTVEVTQIPDYEGALVSDGKDDHGKVTGLPILKDYTVVSKYSRFESTPSYLLSKAAQGNDGAFIFNDMSSSYSFATSSPIDTHTLFSTVLRYQSKYINQGKSINAGSGIDTDSLWLSIIRDNDNRLFAGAFYSMLLFPYSLSEFLLERQLKKYKLGTLYPDMVEFRPIVKSNVEYSEVGYLNYTHNLATIKSGDYVNIGDTIAARIVLNNTLDEIVNAKVNGQECEVVNVSPRVFDCKFIITSKSPQKIDITIDEYIRFEDIVQPYPMIVNLSQDGKILTWGDKLKVGSEVAVTNYTILLPELYTHGGGIRYNGTTINLNAPIVVAKSMVFTNVHTWKLNTTEPHAIYSPQKLNIPNSSLKILGYVPDLTGKGNHGKLNNFAYTEDSGVATDGSIKFDGTEDHITIPTLAHGGKCVMMKVNLQKYDTYLYDQRNNWEPYLAIVSAGNTIAYSYSNQGGKTYIDGILNEHIIDKDLIGITHNITVGNSGNAKSYSPNIGTSFAKGNFTNMSLYEFMLFPEIPSEDEIKKLNDVMGVEGGYVESPNYYWDAYGKKNTDTDRNLIADQVSKDVANALEVKNVAYNSESGYTDDNGLLLDGVEDHAVNTVIPAVTDFTVIAKREFPESTLVNNQTFLVKGDAINGNNNINSLLMECYYGAQNYIISFSHQQIVPLEESKISWITPTSYNGNALTKGSGVDSVGLTIGRYRDLYRKAVFYKAMFYTKTIDQLSINMLKNLFERDELIDVTNPIFKKQ